MVNFTGVMKIGEKYINTNAITTWKMQTSTYCEPVGYLRLRYQTGDEEYPGIYDINNVTAEQFRDKFLEAEKTGFSVIA